MGHPVDFLPLVQGGASARGHKVGWQWYWLFHHLALLLCQYCLILTCLSRVCWMTVKLPKPSILNPVREQMPLPVASQLQHFGDCVRKRSFVGKQYKILITAPFIRLVHTNTRRYNGQEIKSSRLSRITSASAPLALALPDPFTNEAWSSEHFDVPARA